MVGITNIMFALLLTTLTGSIVFIVWRLFYRMFDGTDHFYMIYYGLRVVLLAFLVPVSFLCLWLFTGELSTGGIQKGYFETTGLISDYMVATGIIWMMGVVIAASIHVFQILQLKQLKKYGVIADNQLQEMLLKCKEIVGVEKNVSLYVVGGLTTSFMCGGVHPEIWLPADEMGDNYEMMLIHELIHIKNKDGIFLAALTCAMVLHWFNPFVYFLKGQMKQWDEIMVDYVSSQHIKDTKKYAMLLAQLSQVKGNHCLTGANARTFVGKENITKERIKRMSNFNQLKKKKRSAMALLCATFMAVSAIFVGTTTTIVAEAKEQWYMETMEVDYDSETTSNVVEEFVITEAELAGYAFVEEESDLITVAVQNISWSVGTESVRLSGTFSGTAGGRVSILMQVQPSNLTVRMGLKQPDGTYLLVRGNDVISHAFTLSQTGTYRFVVINDSDEEILQVNGTYIY